MTATHPSELHALFLAGAQAKDSDALLALYEDGGVHPDLDGNVLSGREELRAFFDSLLASVDTFEGGTRKVLVAGDLALTSATWKATIKLPDGTVTEVGGTTAEVSRRQPDGTWLMVLDDPVFT